MGLSLDFAAAGQISWEESTLGSLSVFSSYYFSEIYYPFAQILPQITKFL